MRGITFAEGAITNYIKKIADDNINCSYVTRYGQCMLIADVIYFQFYFYFYNY